jgi:hypothetical protein
VPLPVAGSYREDPTILGQGEGDASAISRRFCVFPFRAVGFSPQRLEAGERSAGWRLQAQRGIIFELVGVPLHLQRRGGRRAMDPNRGRSPKRFFSRSADRKPAAAGKNHSFFTLQAARLFLVTSEAEHLRSPDLTAGPKRN